MLFLTLMHYLRSRQIYGKKCNGYIKYSCCHATKTKSGLCLILPHDIGAKWDSYVILTTVKKIHCKFILKTNSNYKLSENVYSLMFIPLHAYVTSCARWCYICAALFMQPVFTHRALNPLLSWQWFTPKSVTHRTLGIVLTPCTCWNSCLTLWSNQTL